ncbi:MAG: ABC transporter substrate-binding protein [Deltaproteobacteria bacterium]|nr:ABC transporter substrate-binding protein [Deltaproteobacteria bacterium]
MKKFMIIAICICGGLFLSVSASEAKQAPYVIGIAVDLTGRAAGLGIPEKRVYLMKAEEFNKAGGVNGRHLKLIILDNETKPAKAVINTKKLIEVEKVIATLGYSTSGSTLASAETVMAGETVLVSNAASEKIWKPTKKWVFNVVPRQKDACTPILVDGDYREVYPWHHRCQSPDYAY